MPVMRVSSGLSLFAASSERRLMSDKMPLSSRRPSLMPAVAAEVMARLIKLMVWISLTSRNEASRTWPAGGRDR